MKFEKKRVLILVKTYPNPSNKSIETVCTAGITDDGKWIRLYPIPHRFLDGKSQFKIFDWIEVNAAKRPISKDRRPESYSVDSESIEIVSRLDSREDIATRYRIISSLEQKSLETLKRDHEDKGTSLGVIHPKSMTGLSLVKDADDWTEEQKNQLNQTSMLDKQHTLYPLKKVPYKIFCTFTCNDDNCKGHRISLTSWEYNWTLLKLLEKNGNDKEKAERELHNRWMKQFENKKGYLFLGTINSIDRYGTFIVIGHCSFPKDVENYGEQLSLL